jgi:hypothetical protein
LELVVFVRCRSVFANAFAGADEQMGEDGVVLGDFEGETAEFVFGGLRLYFPGLWGGHGKFWLAGRDIETMSE